MDQAWVQTLFTASAYVLPTLIAITFHEAAHAYAARMLGDDTAHRMGRVSLNPLRHVDPFGTLLLPALLIAGQLASLGEVRFLFGYAKPVPVDFRNLYKPRRDMMLVAAAGPAMNLVLAFISALILAQIGDLSVPNMPVSLLPPDFWAGLWGRFNLLRSVQMNLVLMLFNLLPILPLDGGRILFGLLPYRLAMLYAGTERIGILVVLLGFLVLPEALASAGIELRPLEWALAGPLDFMVRLVFAAAGY
ncbi:MAG: site-2 protease family protein [Alphaproteobacteria bacterium]|nr:site-2 protease family protein [Alphaproteobacteria bacterium]